MSLLLQVIDLTADDASIARQLQAQLAQFSQPAVSFASLQVTRHLSATPAIRLATTRSICHALALPQQFLQPSLPVLYRHELPESASYGTRACTTQSTSRRSRTST